jgi:hypothetical protein
MSRRRAPAAETGRLTPEEDSPGSLVAETEMSFFLAGGQVVGRQAAVDAESLVGGGKPFSARLSSRREKASSSISESSSEEDALDEFEVKRLLAVVDHFDGEADGLEVDSSLTMM